MKSNGANLVPRPPGQTHQMGYERSDPKTACCAGCFTIPTASAQLVIISGGGRKDKFGRRSQANFPSERSKRGEIGLMRLYRQTVEQSRQY